MSDPLANLTNLTPPVETDPVALQRVRGDLMTEIDRVASTGAGGAGVTAPGPRRRRRWLIPAAAVTVVVAASAFTWAATRGGSSATTSIECQADRAGKSWAIVRAETGNPVVDCQAEWKAEHGTAAPPMVAYDNGHGAVRVQLANKAAPKHATKLEPGDYQKPSLIESQNFIDDIGHGLSSACYSEPDARAAIKAQMHQLGMKGWKIVDPKPIPQAKLRHMGKAAAQCTGAFIGPEAGTIHLASGWSVDFGTGPSGTFARHIEGTLSAHCQDLDEATATVRGLAAATKGQRFDVSGPNVVMIRRAPDASRQCTSATAEEGGAFIVRLRGPSS